MSFNALVLPADRSFSKNSMTVIVEDTGGFNQVVNVNLYLWDVNTSGYILIGSQLLYTDLIGRIEIDCSPFYDAAMKADSLPTLPFSYSYLTDRVLRGYIEVTGNDYFTYPIEMHYGGIAKQYERLPAVDFIRWNYKWSTWKPKTSIVSKNQPEFLLFKNWINASGVDFIFTVTDVAGGTGTRTISVPLSGSIYDDVICLCVGYEVQNLQSTIGSVEPAFYTVKAVESGTSNIICEERKYIIDPFERPFERFFIFLNSLGGLDTLRTIGEASPKAVVEDIDVDNIVRWKGYNDAREMMQRAASSEQFIRAVNTGWKTKEEMDWMRDFRLSPMCYEYNKPIETDYGLFSNELLVPIILTKKEVVPSKDNQDVHSMQFEYMPAYLNTTYSPHRLIQG